MLSEPVRWKRQVCAYPKVARYKGSGDAIRGLMKAFGLVVPAGNGSRFESNVRALLVIRRDLPRSCCRSSRRGGPRACARAAELGQQLVACARQSEAC